MLEMRDTDTFVDLLVLRDAAATERYHTKRTLRKQDLASHSFGVMQLLNHIWPECRKNLLLAGMFHDLPEYVTGDVPAPAKRNCPELATVLEEMEKGTAPLYQDFNLTVAEEMALKWADTMELVLWCHEEVVMGNGYATETLKRGLEWCEDIVFERAPGIMPFHVSAPMHTITSRLRRNVAHLIKSKE